VIKRAIKARWWLVVCLLPAVALVPFVWVGLDLAYVSTDNETDYAVPSDVIIISGYPCGEASEPCLPPLNRPYFRSDADVTRGQTSKIVSNTFFPECNLP
jgi:hypothetical protein